MGYDPEKHHRRSIRLKNHDYSRGTYFVTCCTHRDAGAVFQGIGKAIVEQEWLALADRFPGVSICFGPNMQELDYPFVVMPDHFHGVVDMGKTRRNTGPTLGDVMCAFKSLVVNRYIAAVKAGQVPPFPGKIWQRDYYERWIRDDDTYALENITRYIRRNPWRMTVEIPLDGFDSPFPTLQAIGNPHLLERHKVGFLCSRAVPRGVGADVGVGLVSTLTVGGTVVISGFHSPMERRMLDELLHRTEEPPVGIIICLPREMDAWKVPVDWIPALERNQMLILSPFGNASVDRRVAIERNRLVRGLADDLVVPYVAPGGGLEKLLKNRRFSG